MAVVPNADEADPQVLSVDKFLYEDGVYAFTPERVELAKKLCFERLKLLVQSGQCRRIICTCGCPGAGKSTWIAAHGREERTVFFDDLLYTVRHRAQFLQNLKDYEIEVPVEIVAIERDFEAALASNSARPADRQVPLEAMQKFRENYTRPGGDEGFCRVRVFGNSFEDKTGLLHRISEHGFVLFSRRTLDLYFSQQGCRRCSAMQTLNGLRGEIVGFDDKQLRYRVRLHSDNTVKVVAKKNLRLLTLEDLQPAPILLGKSRLVGSRRAVFFFTRASMKPTGWASTPLQEENWTLSLADLEAIFDECEERGFNCRHFRRFVETGTFLGQTVVALSAHFDELHTIEVDSKLFEAAKLASWKAAHPIHFHLGHSAHVLEKILPRLMGPAVFYLDAHYSGSVTGGAFSEVPLLEELVVLERQFMHAGLVVIDDMDLFSKVNSFEMVSGKTGKSRGERASDWRAISCQSICRCFAPQRVQRSFPSRSGNRYILCLGATTSGKDSEPPQLNTACLTYGAACPDLAWRSYGASHWLSVPGHPLSLEGLRHLRAEGPWWSSIADAMEHEHRNSLGSSSTQFLEVVKQMSDARSKTSKLCEKSVDVKLTRQQAIMMHDDLLEVYMDEGFQRKLEAAWNAAGDKRAQQQKAKREVCLPLQMPIVAKYGFEPTEKGVFASLWSIRTTFFNFATEASMDVEMRMKAELMHFLVTPGGNSFDLQTQIHFPSCSPAAPATQHSGSTGSLPAPSQSRDLVPARAPQTPGRITREMVLKAVDRVKADTVALQQRRGSQHAPIEAVHAFVQWGTAGALACGSPFDPCARHKERKGEGERERERRHLDRPTERRDRSGRLTASLMPQAWLIEVDEAQHHPLGASTDPDEIEMQIGDSFIIVWQDGGWTLVERFAGDIAAWNVTAIPQQHVVPPEAHVLAATASVQEAEQAQSKAPRAWPSGDEGPQPDTHHDHTDLLQQALQRDGPIPNKQEAKPEHTTLEDVFQHLGDHTQQAPTATNNTAQQLQAVATRSHQPTQGTRADNTYYTSSTNPLDRKQRALDSRFVDVQQDIEGLISILNRDAEAALVERMLQVATGRAKGLQVRRVRVAANVIRSGCSGDFNVGVGEQATLPMTWMLRQIRRCQTWQRSLQRDPAHPSARQLHAAIVSAPKLGPKLLWQLGIAIEVANHAPPDAWLPSYLTQLKSAYENELRDLQQRRRDSWRAFVRQDLSAHCSAVYRFLRGPMRRLAPFVLRQDGTDHETWAKILCQQNAQDGRAALFCQQLRTHVLRKPQQLAPIASCDVEAAVPGHLGLPASPAAKERLVNAHVMETLRGCVKKCLFRDVGRHVASPEIVFTLVRRGFHVDLYQAEAIHRLHGVRRMLAMLPTCQALWRHTWNHYHVLVERLAAVGSRRGSVWSKVHLPAPAALTQQTLHKFGWDAREPLHCRFKFVASQVLLHRKYLGCMCWTHHCRCGCTGCGKALVVGQGRQHDLAGLRVVDRGATCALAKTLRARQQGILYTIWTGAVPTQELLFRQKSVADPCCSRCLEGVAESIEHRLRTLTVLPPCRFKGDVGPHIDDVSLTVKATRARPENPAPQRAGYAMVNVTQGTTIAEPLSLEGQTAQRAELRGILRIV
ncbi:unnamed protein product [Symbiodinium sp. KB8]|nr:unnamed protein product [Symbiodinium sp. KB8]